MPNVQKSMSVQEQASLRNFTTCRCWPEKKPRHRNNHETMIRNTNIPAPKFRDGIKWTTSQSSNDRPEPGGLLLMRVWIFYGSGQIQRWFGAWIPGVTGLRAGIPLSRLSFHSTFDSRGDGCHNVSADSGLGIFGDGKSSRWASIVVCGDHGKD
ncbi:uncharacterized protein CLUP02_18142 [Colletotrichum lupini]|uniref:Uncharacterized protein n=1 Tax=Colletotrichum lupini TaxID=145971 RepID=A0A9Q8WAZ6_9PEZI|nr:uncharacterized protein CLUP02_18142 [Colletotrichum lupini]UQC76629.1 hypothetical protein CLUP02_18142 [Colletotrichum lupini]